MKLKYQRQIAGALAAGTLFLALTPAVSAQSLWANGGRYRNVFSDRKAQDVGDILTIVISESTTISDTRSNSNSKSGNNNLSAGVGIFDFIKAASSKNTTTGNVTVTVVDVQPNGNLVLEGTQSIWNNKNEHKITFKGICRPEDVTANNTIPSTKIASATVRFDGKGPLNAKQRQGILTQIFNFLF